MSTRGEGVNPSPGFEDVRERVKDGAAGERAEGPDEQKLVLGPRESYVEASPVAEKMADGALCI